MATDYDKFYKDNPNGLGEQTPVISQFFAAYDKKNAVILDLGCGQGRDALPLARLGHKIVGVDISPAGIKDMLSAARRENLDIKAVAADIRGYKPDQNFDVILIDRTLHMLEPDERKAALENLRGHTNPGGYILILDEPKNIPAFKAVLQASNPPFQIHSEKKGQLFMKRA